MQKEPFLNLKLQESETVMADMALSLGLNDVLSSERLWLLSRKGTLQN